MSGGSPVAELRGLAASAILGAERGGQGASAERMLARAAVVGAQARAGYRPRRTSGGLPHCPPETRPVANARATAVLLRLLSDGDAGLIAEWAELAQARGVRVTEATAPVLLDWWARQPRRPEAVFPVLGKRGEWLASLNPAWRKPVAGEELPANAEEVWQTGKTPERTAVLTTIRRADAPRAFAMVQGAWSAEGAEDRRRFIEVLQAGLTIAEEPFLEAALDDKSKTVRRAAAEALVGLRGSRLRERMNARARALIIAEGKKGLLKRSAKVRLEPPAEFDPPWERDGIEEQAASGKGKRAWWLRQIVGAADLSVWTEATGLDPDGVLKAIAEDDYFGSALEGLIEAAGSQGDPAWARAIMRVLLTGKKLDPGDLTRLWRGVATAERHALILEAAGHARFSATERWAVLAGSGSRWTAEFTGSALKLLGSSAPRKGSDWEMYAPVDAVSRLIAPEHAEGFAEAVIAACGGEPTDSFKRSIDRARLRAEMHKEFAS